MSSTDTPAERIPVERNSLTTRNMYDIHFGEVHVTGKYIESNNQSVIFELDDKHGRAGTRSSFPKDGTTFYKHVPTEQEPEHGAEQEPEHGAEQEPEQEPEQLKVPSDEEEPALIASAIEMLKNVNGETDYSFEFINGTKVGKYIENNGTTMVYQVPGSGRVSTPLSWLKSVKNVSA